MVTRPVYLIRALNAYIDANLSNATVSAKWKFQAVMAPSVDLDNVITRVADGEKLALSSLFTATGDKLFGFCICILNNRVQAESLLHHVYLEIWESAGHYQKSGNTPMAWLLKTTRTLAIDFQRSRTTRERTILQQLEEFKPQPFEASPFIEHLNRLDDEEIAVVQAAYYFGATYEELAEIGGFTPAKVRARFCESLNKLGGDNNADNALTGEFALALLRDDEQKTAKQKLEKDPAAHQQLVEWEESIAHLAEAIPPVLPPRHIRIQVNTSLEEPTEVPAPPKKRTRKLSFWRFTSGAVLAVFLGLALLSFFPPKEPVKSVATHFAEISSDDGQLLIIANFDETTGELQVSWIKGEATADLELWLVADGAMAPVSLGDLPNTLESVLVLRESIRSWLDDGTLAISKRLPENTSGDRLFGEILAAGAVIAN